MQRVNYNRNRCLKDHAIIYNQVGLIIADFIASQKPRPKAVQLKFIRITVIATFYEQ